MARGKSKHRPRDDSRLYGGIYPFIQTGDVAKAGLYLDSFSQTYSEFGIQQSKLWHENTLVITIAANIADSAILAIKAAFPDSIIGFETKDNDIVFIKFSLDRASNFLRSKAEISSQANLNQAKLSEISFTVPSLPEQIAIGTFFRTLDTTITLHQRKLDGLRELKRGYLQQMFPQAGERVPRVRFGGFSKEWTERRLDEVADLLNNLRVPVASSERIKGCIPYYGANGIQDYVEGFTHDGEFVLLAEDGANDLTNYPVRFVRGKIWVNNHAHVLVGKASILDNTFLAERLKAMDITPFLVGGTRAKLNAYVLKVIEILIPSISEQIAIGKFFRTMDTQITALSTKTERLKELKAAYLQKMFV